MTSFKTYRWYLLITIALLYFLVCLHRVAPTVIAQDLIASLKTDAFLLGVISSAYFYLYSAMQPLVGFFTDTAGSRRVIISFYSVAAAGSIVFGLATTPSMAVLGRALVGFGMAGIFIPALKLFSRWFAPRRFSGLTGLMLTVGGLGGIFASLPLTYLVEAAGWRMSFIILGLTSFLLTGLAFFIIHNTPEEKGWPSPEVPSPAVNPTPNKGIMTVVKNVDFWLIFFSTFFAGGVSITFQGLWCVPYLVDVFKISRLQAGWLLMLLPLGFAIGGPLFGFLTEHFKINEKKVIVVSLFISVGLWALLLLYGGKANLITIIPIFFTMGLISGGILPLYFAITRGLFPSSLMGRATGAMNTAAFIGAAIYQPLSGLLLDLAAWGRVNHPAKNYWILIVFFIFSQLAALIFSSFIRGGNKGTH